MTVKINVRNNADERTYLIFESIVGQQNDARMNLAIALTAARQGATICNHVEVLELMKKKDESGKDKLCGAKVKDTITGKT